MAPEIHSFHCNVDNGDAAIHLLATPAAAGGSSAKPTVVKAVLVDGGKAASVDKIKRVIDLINDTYTFTGSTTLKFDSVVVTTWSIDHYGGVVSLVLSDLSDTNKTCSFFRYDGTGNTPKTILYSPYWNGSAASKMPNTSKRAPCRDIRLNADFLKFESTNVATRTVDFVQGTKSWPKICRLVAGSDELIGCELLSGTLGTGSGSFANLAAMAPSTSTGIYCIGADGQTFDKDGKVVAVTLDPPSQKGPAQKGTSSIALVAVIQGKAKHYFSGDNDPQFDQQVSGWMGQEVPVMKLSGHGNVTSATTSMLKSLNPSHFICSTGTSLSQHHPRWELLVLLKAFMASKTTAVIKPFFHPTNHPVYLTSVAKQLALDFEAFSADSTDANVKALRQAIFAYDPVLLSIITTAIQDLKSSAERVRWVVDWLRNTWNTFSYSIAEQHPVIGSQTASGVTVSAETQILTIRAILTATDVSIGYINGMRNLVASSDVQAQNASTTLPSFMGKNWKEPSPRTKPASEKPLELKDTAREAVSLPTKLKFGKAKPENTWTDLDDEAPRDQYVALLSKIEPSMGVVTKATLPTIAGSEAPQIYYASRAYADAQNVRRVVDKGFDSFIAGFEPGYLGFKTPADADTGTLDPAKNLWAYYMSAPLINTDIDLKIGANTTGDESTKHPVQSLSLNCGLFKTKPDGKPLVFGTESIQAQFNTPSLRLRNTTDKGCTIKDSDVVLVALEDSTPAELEGDVTLDTILGIFHMQPTAKTPPSGLDRVRKALGTLPMKLKVKDVDGAEAYRNAIWCFPGDPYRFTLKLNFSVQDDKIMEPINKLMGLLKDYLGIDAGKALPDAVTDQFAKFGLEATMSATYIQNTSNDYFVSVEPTARFSFAIKAGGIDLPFAIEVGNTGDLELSISPKPGSDSEDGMVEAVAKLRSGEATDKPSGSGLQDFFDGIKLTNAWIARKEKQITFGISLLSTLSNRNNQKVPIGFTYSSAGVFGGALILGDGPDKEDKLLPEYDAERDPTALIPAPHATNINFNDIFGISPPKGIPSEITQAMFTYSKTSQQFKLHAALQSSLPDEAGEGYVPALDFKSIALTATKDKTKWTGTLDATVELNGAEGSALTPAVMTVNFEKAQDSWLVKAHVDNLRLGLLYSHFPAGFQNAAADFLGKLVVNSLDAVYTHDSSGGATSFNISGVVSFGGLELRLAYQYVGHKLGQNASAAKLEKDGAEADSPLKQGSVVVKETPKAGKPAEWSFDAIMGSAGGQTTKIRNILDSIDGVLSDFLPGFVLDTEIAPTDGGRPPVILSLNTIKAEIDGSEDDYLMLQAFIEIGDLNLTFIQMSNKKNDSAIPKPGQGPAPPTRGASAAPKRILRFALSKLPLVQNIPLVGQLPQPFDDLEYVWVSYPEDGRLGTTGESDAARTPLSRGFSMQEIDAINTNLEAKKIPTIKYKKIGSKADTLKKPAASVTKTVVLAAGQHFIITHKGEAVVDYVFGSKKKATNTQGLIASGATSSEDAAATEEAPDEKPVKKGALGTTIGPLSIENVGLKVENDRLYLILDATFKLGPITFALLGFGVGFAIFKLKNLSKDSLLSLASSIDLQLHGMELSFDQPPINLAGIFIHNDSNGVNSYAGGIAVGFPPYLFMAVGEYDEIDRVINNITEKYKSIFLYAKLDGPLITLEFATIEGVPLGFGVNSNVRQPRIEELNDFPFITDKAANDGGANLLAILSNMQAWITPKKESYWGAAGLRVTTFEVLEVTAVMLLQFSSKGCDIAIYGDAVARMPPESPPAATIIYLELDFAIILSFTEGFMSIQAALAPTSHILVPQCQLTGGFALCYWFSPSPYAGDWVFSAGGYHKAFQVPDHYPVPKRIGISFQVGKMIGVTGEAYFAVCPKAVMGGGRLHIQIDVGPVSAWCDAHLDCLIMFKPFHYMIEVGISVGVSFNIDAWIVHIHISASIDADLSISGPPFGGTAYVDFHLFGFSIDFGASPNAPKAIGYDEFLAMVQRPGPETGKPDSAAAGSVQDPNSEEAKTLKTMANLHITLEDGSFPSEEGPKGKESDPNKLPANDPFTEWRVRAGDLKFRVGCDFAAKTYNVSDQGLVTVQDPQFGITSDVYANPMHLRDPVDTSFLAVTISNAEGTVKNWRCTPIVKPVPKAIWRQYDEATDPTSKQGGNRSQDLLDGADATMNQAMGVSVLTPAPTLSEDTIPEFHARDAMSENVNDKNPKLPVTDEPPKTPWRIEPVPQQTDQLLQWKSVSKTWKEAPAVQPSAGDGPSELAIMLNACATALGWDQPAAETLALMGVKDAADLPKPKPWELSAEVPEMLLRVDIFASAFLRLPMLASAA